MTNNSQGLSRIREILGPQSEKIIKNLTAMSPDLAGYIINIAYGEFYTRPNMSDKYREIAAVACLVGQKKSGPAFKSHVEGMLNVGHSRNDVIELLLFLIPYIGFPTIIDSIRSTIELFDAIDLRKDTNS